MGISSLITIFGLVLAVGLWAGRRRPTVDSDSDELMLAGRSLPLWIALCTMTATWVGGGYINGTAEVSFTSGALWGGQAGLGFALSLTLGGLFFARPMRRRNYVTLVDPFEQRYGRNIAAVLMVPAVLAEVIWSGAILVAVGTTSATLLDIDVRSAILLSATIAIAYTAIGGLRAVAYTDIVQLLLVVTGLGIALPFALHLGGGLTHVLVDAFPPMQSPHEVVSYTDLTVVLVLGGIPWNVYFQRILASKNEQAAVRLSLIAGPLCALLAIPPLLMGLVAAKIEWTHLVGADQAKLLYQNGTLALPYMLRYVVPGWVAWLALGAVTAAVMSSVDSSILSAASLVAWNGYRKLFRPHATPRQIASCIRLVVLGLGFVAATLAISVPSVKELWYLCADVVYCVLFPQLALALFDRKANAFGALAGFLSSIVLRLGGGVESLGLPSFLPYPNWTIEFSVDFPYRTFAMASGLLIAYVVARCTQAWSPPRSVAPGTNES